MNSIIAFALKFSGFSWVWDKIDGWKTKIAAIGLMLSGASMMLAGASSIVMTLYACGQMSCVIELIRSIASNPNAKTVLDGFLAFNAGLGGFGLRHAIEKASSGPGIVKMDAVRGLVEPSAPEPGASTPAAGPVPPAAE